MAATPQRTRSTIAISALVLLSLALAPTAASADTTIDGPIGLGTAADFSVLAGSTVTNTGPSVLDADLGLSPGTSVTGFPPGIVNGTLEIDNEVAEIAKGDLTTAYNVAASLTPDATGFGDLTGESLVPGVYSGGELSVTGELTLAGTAESVWVFQAASTLTVGSGAIVTVTGGASVCNVFWQVGSSATIEPGAQFVGTVMADASITAQTAATITGRLLASTGAVTLDTNTLIAPTGCDTPPGTVTSSPEITSESPSNGTVGEDYSHTITATGTPEPTYSVTEGELPPGLVLDEETGEISGQPTGEGEYEFEITVSNGASPDATETYVITIGQAVPAPGVPDDGAGAGTPGDTPEGELAESGVDVGAQPLIAALLVSLGVLLLSVARLRSSRGTRVQA